jgi:hypothetical protein
MPNKNILIYTHMPNFSFEDGGTVVQYNLGKLLDEELNQMVRMYPFSGIESPNPIFNKFYKPTDFPIDDNTVVIYCEGTLGNPLGVKNVVRWMLSVLGQNVPHSFLDTWARNELVYHFNSESRFFDYPDRKGVFYKMLSCIYINPEIKQTNFGNREGSCFAIGKPHFIPNKNHHSRNYIKIHDDNSCEIIRHESQGRCIEKFNTYKYFYCYDSNSFLTFMAAMCGCISIVYPVEGMSKSEWVKTTAAKDYLNSVGEEKLYGVAYGVEEISFAESTLHLAKKQWDEIINFCKETTLIPFVRDINDFENMQNTIENNYFI